MTTCDYCHQEMISDSTTGCSGNNFIFYANGVKLAAIPHDGAGRCHDCNVEPGAHHHPGCDMERCPSCGGQLIACGCKTVSDGLLQWGATP